MDSRRRLVATVGLVALVLVDLVLIVAALRSAGRSGSADAPASSQTGAPAVEPTGVAGTAGAPAAASDGAPGSPVVPLGVVLSAVDGTTAWRGPVGSCAVGGAGVQVTTDGGTTWRDRTSPYPVVTRISATDARKAFVVGADDTCTMGVRSTTDGGVTWPGTLALADTLARDPKEATRVRAPGGRVVAPCGTLAVVDLARNSAIGAEALCAGGALRSSTDDGRTWLQAAQVTGAMAMDSRLVRGTVTAYVASVTSGCPGVQVSAVTAGGVTALGCARTPAPPTPGRVAISVPTTDAAWLLVGSQTFRSSDGLMTWSAA